MNCTDVSTFAFYDSYHTHPINKFMHLLGIPTIMSSSLIILRDFIIQYEYYKHKPTDWRYGIRLNNLLLLFYTVYYYTYGWYPGVIMHVYLTFLNWLSHWIAVNKKISLKNTSYLFILAWGFQFIGHFIEGNRPALTDSIGQAFLGAPIFSLTPIVPGLKAALIKA